MKIYQGGGGDDDNIYITIPENFNNIDFDKMFFSAYYPSIIIRDPFDGLVHTSTFKTYNVKIGEPPPLNYNLRSSSRTNDIRVSIIILGG